MSEKNNNYYYNNWNELITQILPNGTQSTTVYDRMNATVQSTDVEGQTQVDTYDRFGRVIKNQLGDPNNLVTTWSGQYNNANLLLSALDGENKLTEYKYDIRGNLTRVDTPDQQSNNYDYNSLGQLIWKYSPNGETQHYTYDELGRLIKKQDNTQQNEKYYYDGNHQVIKYVDNKGQEFTYSYNRGRLLTESGPVQSGQVQSISFKYSLAGLRTGMKDNGNRITGYLYDEYTGELEQTTYPDGHTIQYGYYANGAREWMQTPFGDRIDYGYEGQHAGRLVEVKWNGINQASYQYHQNGPLDYQQQANGFKTQYSYDTMNRIDLISYSMSTTNLKTLDYGYDNNHNILSIQETVGNTLPTIKDYTYDAMNRIKTSKESPQSNESYAYDANGNRANLLMIGKELAIKEASYEYDQWNRLIEAKVKNLETTDPNDWKTVEYVYNGDHLMVERKEDSVTTRYYYDGSHIIAEGTVNENGTVVPKASYLYGSTGLIMREDELDQNKSKVYYVMNGHGDVVELRNATGSVVQSYTYDLWGNAEGSSSHTGIDQPFLYSGEYWDATIELQYLRARWYDPSVGRFITEDTYEGDISNSLSLNLYTYVHNNPLKYVDPSGHIIELSSNATEREKKEYERAIEYLKTSEDGKALIEKLENSKTVFTINFIDHINNTYSPTTNDIYWNIRLGILMSDGTSVTSAAIVLAHEMGHAAQHLDGELDEFIKDNSDKNRDKVEAANLKKYEIPIAKQLGELYRKNYDSHLGVITMNNSIHFITTHTYSFDFYLNLKNWGKSNKYTRHHNRYPLIDTTLEPRIK